MKKGQRLWTRDELIVTMNLYCKTPFGRLHKSNPDVIELSKLIGRTPSSIAFKLVNFASLDPSLQKRGIKGAKNSSKLDRKIWNEFYNNLETVAYESEVLRAKFEGKSIEETIFKEIKYKKETLTERKVVVKQRINQSFFRSMVLASYNSTCCITGIKIPELLIAGHIKPWSIDKENRLNPRNGIAINNLHDKAFEIGLITIDTNYQIKVATELLSSKDTYIQKYFNSFHQKEIILPSKFLPDTQFLEYHYFEKFRG